MTNPLNPLQLWLEKKLYLEHQLAITSDASQKFALRKQIQECELEIARLSNQPPTQSNPTTYQFSQSNQPAQSNQSNVSASQQHQCSQENIPKITFNTPKIIDIGVDKLKDVISKVQILLLTVNEWERKALLSEMTPLDGEESILQGALSSLTYRIGMFGNYCAAYTESTMGSGGRHGATLTAERAINELKPKAVFLLGIAFGIDNSKQKLGDVLIAESIFSYELQKLNNDFAIHRGQSVPCGAILSERFRMRRSDWKPYNNGQSFDVNVHQGLVLSGDKVVNNKEFRDALVKGFPTAIGGEMEGAGAYAAVTNPTEVILIKSICDWADGDKNDYTQPFAAFTSVSLAKHVLSKPDVLLPLFNEPKLIGVPHESTSVNLGRFSFSDGDGVCYPVDCGEVEITTTDSNGAKITMEIEDPYTIKVSFPPSVLSIEAKVTPLMRGPTYYGKLFYVGNEKSEMILTEENGQKILKRKGTR